MGPDQGFRYELAGAVAELDVLAPLMDVHPAARLVALNVTGLGVLSVTEELATAVTPAMICAVLGTATIDGGPESTGRASAALHTGPESGFTRLTPGLLSLLEAASAAGPVAYLEADYLGRDGHQTAAVWRSGTLVLGPLLLGRTEAFVSRDAPISQALRSLGVVAQGRFDEFVVSGLGRHRRTEDWISRGGV